MMQLFCIIAILSVAVIFHNATTVRSARFCRNTNRRFTCPGDDQVEIRHPFWIHNSTVDDHGTCTSYPPFQINCADSGRRLPVMNISNNLYYILNIDYVYTVGRLTVIDVGVDEQECPRPQRNISTTRFLNNNTGGTNMSIFYNCSRHPQNAVQRIPCLDNYYYNNNTSTSTGRSRTFAFLEEEISSHGFDWYESCEKTVSVPVIIPRGFGRDPTQMNYTRALKRGFELNWYLPLSCDDCRKSGGNCWANETGMGITSPFHCNCTDGETREDYYCRYFDHKGISMRVRILIGISAGVGGILLVLLVICGRNCMSRCWKKMKGPTNVEAFIGNNYESLSLQSYKYSDIKKMTDYFKDKIGQGGYGSVFKGKLYNGKLVAIKVLNKSKGKGEDFINEVATIGRTNHVNVVNLLGFCIEGTKQALVYEFMENGSLEKFIHNAKDSRNTSAFLGWEKLYQIAVGIARGLAYLHRGCNTRILHFDIKPHNILLDQNFCPKISDFGLAKLCPTIESLVSMVDARGTIGYIAPEVYCRNFGGVSHKSDVYSYGTMVLEMIGGRRNIGVTMESDSELYFPLWIYKRLKSDIMIKGTEMRKVVVDGEIFTEEVTKKMIIVSLWCMQAHPINRPSMTKVVEMLEGSIEELEFPPNPFPDPSSKQFSSS